MNEVLEDLGYVCNTEEMKESMRRYSEKQSQTTHYNGHNHYNTGYGLKCQTLPKQQNSIGNSDGYNQNGKQQKPIPSKTYYPENNRYNQNEKNENRQENATIQKNSNPLGFSKKAKTFYKNTRIPAKYWAMRHTLFSKFDRGIIMDIESCYSVCPEVLSCHIAKRCKNNTVVDPFCGAGGNIIQLAFTCKKVIAVDIDPIKIELARHNAEIYGFADKIEFIVGDIFEIYPPLKADVLFMSPPWGGPGYSKYKSYSLQSMCDSYVGGGLRIFEIAKTIAPNIAFHMPKTTNILECMWLANYIGKVEIQQNIINGRLNSITAFYGHFEKN